jgi:hypothetical protein
LSKQIKFGSKDPEIGEGELSLTQGNPYKKYGWTVERYNEVLEEQDYRCKICGKYPNKTALAVDHCHETGKVRGLLCTKCNTGLGLFCDSPELLIKAFRYIMNSRKE